MRRLRVQRAMAVKIKRERPDQRRHHRVTAPLFIRVEGHRLRVANWSLGGLRVDGYPGVLPSAGSELALHIILPFQGFDVSFDVMSEVARTNVADKSFAVRFTEIGERERELMQHFVEELVRGSMSDIDDTIQRIDVPVTPARLEPDLPKISTEIPVRRWPLKTVVMTALYAIAGLLIIGYAGLLGYGSIYRMEIQSAVISAPVETVSAQADGRVVLTGLQPGDDVRAGDVVVKLVDSALEREIQLASSEVEERKAQLVYLKQKQVEELNRLKGYASLELKNVRQSKVELEGLRDQLAVAQGMHARVKLLYDKGYSTAARLAESKKQVIDLKSKVERLRIELRTRVDLAEKNFGKRLFTGQTLEGEAVDAEAKVRLAEHEIQLAKDRLSAFEKQRDRTAVVAPFDGTILSLPRIDKGSVRKGDTIAVIEQRKDRSVTAFLNQDEILKVGLGDEALIYIPAVGEMLKGFVKGIDRTSAFINEQDRHELPGYTWRMPSDRSARIAIDFAEPHKIADAALYRSGLPVVVFERRPTNSLLSELKKRLAVSM